MRKFLNVLKIVLFSILFILNIIYIKIFMGLYPMYIVYLLLFIIFGVLIVRDLVRHIKINYDIVYNLLCISVLAVMIFIMGRAIFDQNFIYNSPYYLNLIKEYSIQSNIDYVLEIKQANIEYVAQNDFYFVMMMALILIYRKLNVEKKESKYNQISLGCFFISILSVIPTISVLSGANAIKYLIFTSVLVGIEIYNLIKDNHKKYEWIIFLSFFFNLFAFISIFINLIVY